MSEKTMTDKEWSDLWKKEIENSLTEVQKLREQLRPIPFHSPLWEEYHGAYGEVRENVAFLFCPRELVPQMDKIVRLDFEEKGDDRINFDNLCENLSHQLSFYSATYLAMPYLVLLLEKKRREQDFRWQMLIIEQAGIILSTDSSPEEENCESVIPKEILYSYQISKKVLRSITEEFLARYLEELKKQEKEELKYFVTALLAIFGDPGAAFQLVMGSWEQTPVACPECDYFDEEMEDGFYEEELMKEKIEPAESVIGKWDGKSFENTYLWFSNLAHELGIEEEWKIPYYYGTYTCPECGEKGILIEWMKICEM